MVFVQLFLLFLTIRFLIPSFWKDHRTVVRPEISPSHVTLRFQPINDHRLNVPVLPQWMQPMELFLTLRVPHWSNYLTLNSIYHEEILIRFYMLDFDLSIFEWYHAAIFLDFHLALQYPTARIIHIHPITRVSINILTNNDYDFEQFGHPTCES